MTRFTTQAWPDRMPGGKVLAHMQTEFGKQSWHPMKIIPIHRHYLFEVIRALLAFSLLWPLQVESSVINNSATPLFFTELLQSVEQADEKKQILMLNPVVLEAPVGSLLYVNLSDKSGFAARINKIHYHIDGGQTLVAKAVTGISNGVLSSEIIISHRGSSYTGNISGRIIFNDKRLLLVSDGKALHLVDYRARGKIQAPVGDDYAIPDVSGNHRTALQKKVTKETGSLFSKPMLSISVSSPEPAADKSIIDILVLYTPGMQQLHPGKQLASRLNYLIALSNQAFIESHIDIQLRLVRSEEIDYSDSGSNYDTLVALSSGSDGLAKARVLRNRYGADLVILMRPFSFAQHHDCGFTWIYTGYANHEDSWAYSVVSDGEDADSDYYCDEYTFAHELGHSFGSAHNHSWGYSETRFSYAYGHGIDGLFGTIMARIYPTVGLFSNPGLLCFSDYACGVPEGELYEANNHLAFNYSRHEIVQFRDTQVLYDNAHYPLTTEPEHTLRLGPFAEILGIDPADHHLQLGWIAAELIDTADVLSSTSDLLDVNIAGLAKQGGFAHVLVHMAKPLSKAPLFRILKENQWQTFDDDQDQIRSAASEAGICPTIATLIKSIPSIEPLQEGHDCILIRLQDGGDYDNDGKANASIALSGMFVTAHSIANLEALRVPPVTVRQGNHNVVLLAFQIDTPVEAQLTALRLQASGSGDELVSVSQVLLYEDNNKNGSIDEEEFPVMSGQYDTDDGLLTLNLNEGYSLAAGTTNFLVSYDF